MVRLSLPRHSLSRNGCCPKSRDKETSRSRPTIGRGIRPSQRTIREDGATGSELGPISYAQLGRHQPLLLVRRESHVTGQTRRDDRITHAFWHLRLTRQPAVFFKSISTSGRIAGLFDFVNRKIFFKEIHASFKFCAIIFGGEKRKFHETQCAFFLHSTETLSDTDRCFPMGPEDFSRVNPNTGTAPVFRNTERRRHHPQYLRTAHGSGGSL